MLELEYDASIECFVRGGTLSVEPVQPDEVLRLDIESVRSTIARRQQHHIALPEKISRFPARVFIVIGEYQSTPGWHIEVHGRFGNERKRVVPFGYQTMIGSTWHPLLPFDVDSLCELLGITPGSELPSLSFGLLLKLHGSAQGRQLLRTDKVYFSRIVEQLANDADEGTVFPLSQHISLRPYQYRGALWITQAALPLRGCILADEMGLGKSVQLIAAMARNRSHSTAACLLVLPSSLIANWQRELRKFAPNLSWIVHRGPRRTTSSKDFENFDVVITTYDTFVSDQSLFVRMDFSMIVCDEAHYFRNPDTARFKALRHVRSSLRSSTVVLATGTPVQNSLADAWALVDIAIPGLLGDIDEFRSSFPDTVEGAERLEELLTPIMLRRRVSDVLKDLPDRIDITHEIELADVEALAYETVRSSAAVSAPGLGAIMPMRMYCAHPRLVCPEWAGIPIDECAKYRKLVELLFEVRSLGEKALVFCAFNEAASLIADDIRARTSLWTGVLNGRVAVDERQALVDEFSGHDGPAVLVANPVVGGFGLNIQAANHVFHYTLEWNPSTISQATARAHRSGQEKPVRVHYFVAKNTVDEVMLRRLIAKQALADAAVVGFDTEDTADLEAALSLSPASGLST